MAQVLHARMQEIAEPVEDDLAAERLYAGDDVGMVARNDIDASLADRDVAQFADIAAGRPDAHFPAVVHG
jgi:capsid protein